MLIDSLEGRFFRRLLPYMKKKIFGRAANLLQMVTLHRVVFTILRYIKAAEQDKAKSTGF